MRNFLTSVSEKNLISRFALDLVKSSFPIVSSNWVITKLLMRLGKKSQLNGLKRSVSSGTEIHLGMTLKSSLKES